MPENSKQPDNIDNDQIDKILKELGIESEVPGKSQPVTDANVDELLKFAETSAPSAPSITSARPAAKMSYAPFNLDQFPETAEAKSQANIDMLMNVALSVKIELGKCRMRVKDILSLSKGSVVELDKLAGDPLDIFVNEQLVAKGEILVLGDDTFCIRVTEIIPKKDKVK